MPLDKDFFRKVAELTEADAEFAVATVIAVKGSSSGKVGDKALFDGNGKRILGYIGGGCIENRVAKTVPEALFEKQPRIINIDLDSDQMGMGIPCGGYMSVIVEPRSKSPTLLIRGMGRVVEALSQLGNMVDFKVIVQTPEDEASRHPSAEEIITDPLELDALGFSVDYLILATHHRDDDKMSLQALQMGIPFVAVVASGKKTSIILDYLGKHGLENEHLERFHAPAGLDLRAKSAEEIALSIMSEMVMHRNGGTGEPMRRMTSGESVRK